MKAALQFHTTVFNENLVGILNKVHELDRKDSYSDLDLAAAKESLKNIRPIVIEGIMPEPGSFSVLHHTFDDVCKKNEKTRSERLRVWRKHEENRV